MVAAFGNLLNTLCNAKFKTEYDITHKTALNLSHPPKQSLASLPVPPLIPRSRKEAMQGPQHHLPHMTPLAELTDVLPGGKVRVNQQGAQRILEAQRERLQDEHAAKQQKALDAVTYFRAKLQTLPPDTRQHRDARDHLLVLEQELESLGRRVDVSLQEDVLRGYEAALARPPPFRRARKVQDFVAKNVSRHYRLGNVSVPGDKAEPNSPASGSGFVAHDAPPAKQQGGGISKPGAKAAKPKTPVARGKGKEKLAKMKPHETEGYNALAKYVKVDEAAIRNREWLYELVEELSANDPTLPPVLSTSTFELCSSPNCGAPLQLTAGGATLACTRCSCTWPYFDSSSSATAFGSEVKINKCDYGKCIFPFQPSQIAVDEFSVVPRAEVALQR